MGLSRSSAFETVVSSSAPRIGDLFLTAAQRLKEELATTSARMRIFMMNVLDVIVEVVYDL